MDEIGHVPSQMWAAYGESAINPGTTWFVSPQVGGIPSPQARLVYFTLNPVTVGQQGLVTLCLPTSVPHGIVNSASQYVFPIKSWWVPPLASEHPDIADVFEFVPLIPIAFDAVQNTFSLLNGDPYGNFQVGMQFSYMISVLPLH
jgi:hypothetical protein